MKNLLLMIPLLIAGIFGSYVAGSVEDYVMPQIQEIPNQISNCETMNTQAWKDACEKQKTTYNKGITLVNFAGFVSGFGTVGIIINRILD